MICYTHLGLTTDAEALALSILQSRNGRGEWGNTFTNAWTLTALSAYERSLKKVGEPLAATGRFDLSADPAFRDAASRYGFVSGKSTHADRLATIRDTWKRFALMIDTHTADGVKVALAHREAGVPMICLETAQAVKFADTVREALGVVPEAPLAVRGLQDLPQRFDAMDADVTAVKRYIELHCAGNVK